MQTPVTARSLALLLAALGVLSQSACTTLFGGRTQPLKVTSDPEGAHVYINDVDSSRTPLTMSIKRRHAPLTLRVQGDSAAAVTTVITRHVSYAGLAFDFSPTVYVGTIAKVVSNSNAGFGGGFEITAIATGIDLLTGSLWLLKSDSLHVTLPQRSNPRP